MVWICSEISVDNMEIFSVLLSGASTESRAFLLLLTPPHQQAG